MTAVQDHPQLHEASAVGQPAVETSMLGRFVALLTPVFVVAAGWVAGAVAKAVPGAHLDQSQLVTFMVIGATGALTCGLKWLHGWQQHERLVAEGKERPRGKPQPRGKPRRR
jgi:hypothetical protein